jgi:hypothetical protein
LRAATLVAQKTPSGPLRRVNVCPVHGPVYDDHGEGMRGGVDM